MNVKLKFRKPGERKEINYISIKKIQRVYFWSNYKSSNCINANNSDIMNIRDGNGKDGNLPVKIVLLKEIIMKKKINKSN